MDDIVHRFGNAKNHDEVGEALYYLKAYGVLRDDWRDIANGNPNLFDQCLLR
jgi:hypothetical protein